MYLGTRTGQIYLTQDGGSSWNRLTGLATPSGWVVDSLLVDPSDSRILYAGMWSGQGSTGGIFKSRDSGLHWTELGGMHGQSVNSLAISAAASKILVAGTLEGVFRSEDGGETWRRISPLGHKEIRNIHGLAIDPADPGVVYAGTWHLAWKTSDAGAHWFPIQQGMAGDSDVFSMVVDPVHTQTVYAAACSGIYRSDNGGLQWTKMKGLPYTSRRTRVLAMDPRAPQVVYAGTTEGLWRTRDGGESWKLMTQNTWVINAIVLAGKDARHWYLGMDNSGVLQTRDDGASFQEANNGFAQREVSSLIADPVHQGRFYVALMAEGQSSSVLVTDDGGLNWRDTGPGLRGRDVLSLLVVTQPAWKLLAGTSGGVFEYSPQEPAWQNRSIILPQPGEHYIPTSSLSVWALYRRDSREPIYAATSAGLLESENGRSWKRLPLPAPNPGVSDVATGGEAGRTILAATWEGMRISNDFGQNWKDLRVDGGNQLRGAKIVSQDSRPNVFFVAGTTGLFRSTDGGETWEKFGHGLPFSSVRAVAVSPRDANSVMVASSAGLFQSTDGGAHYSRLAQGAAIDDLPIQLLALHPLSRLPILAASTYNGLFQYDGADSSDRALAAAETPNR